jgi:hypothetical protein
MSQALELVGLDSAFGWVQVRLRGGWFNLLVTSVAYGLALGGTMFVPARLLDIRSTSQYYGGWVNGLLGLQAAVLLLFAASRVTAAVRLDISTRMIESHRLMPAGPGSAIAGYLVGASSQGLCLAAATFVLGVFAAAGAGLPLERWLYANLILGLFSVFTWVVLAYFAFFARLPFFLVLLPIGAFWLTQGAVLSAVPALAVLCSPFLGWSVFAMRTTGMEYPYGVAAVAQLGIGALFFEAARRKYRREDAVGIGPVLGLLLLAGFVGVSWAGLWQWDDFGPRYLRNAWVPQDVQVICSLLCVMLLATVPVTAAARQDADRHRRLMSSNPHDERPPSGLPDLLVVALAAAAISVLVWLVQDENAKWRLMPAGPGRDAARRTSITVLLFLVAFSYVARAAYRHVRRPRLVATVWLLVTWLGPLLADLVRYSQTERTRYDEPAPQALGWLSTCSPVGAGLALWHGSEMGPIDVTVGLWVQAGLAVLAVGVFYATARARYRVVALPDAHALRHPER